MGWDGGVRLALGAPFCPWALSLGSPLLSLRAVSGGYPRDRPRCPWELSLESSPLSPGCLRVAAIGSSFPVSRLGSGDRQRLCLRCRSRGLNHLCGLSASQAAPLRCAAVGDRQSHKSGAVAAGWELTWRVPLQTPMCKHCFSGESKESHDLCQSSVSFTAQLWYRLFPLSAAGRGPGLVLATWEGVSHSNQHLPLVPSARK